MEIAKNCSPFGQKDDYNDKKNTITEMDFIAVIISIIAGIISSDYNRKTITEMKYKITAIKNTITTMGALDV
jgi:hypothetical protein